MQGYSLKPSHFVAGLLLGAGLALAAALPTAGPAAAQGMDRDMMHLQDQLRDCRGDACEPVREEMMSRLRQRLDNCAGGQCDQIQERLRLHQQVQNCHMTSDRGCRELRMQERAQVRPRYYYGNGGNQGMGMGGGQGMGGGMGGGQGRRMGGGN